MKPNETTKTTTNQVVAFYRVSTDVQSNDRQKEDVKKYIKAFGWELVQEFEEIISGASNMKDRKELKRMLSYIDEHKPSFVICSELSRLARSQDAVNIIRDWTSKGICFVTIKESIRTLDQDGKTNPMTELILNIMTALNIFELENVKYRTKSGLNKSALKGHWVGGSLPYGYDLINKKLVINKDEAENIKKIFTWYSEGWGTDKIARHLNVNQIKTKRGSSWAPQKIVTFLNNSLYNGKRVWKDEIINSPELKIIDDSTFTAVQDKINKKQNTTEINKVQKYQYLLSHKVVCACGRHFVGEKRSNRYVCRSQKHSSGCKIKSVRMNWLDNEIITKIRIEYNKLLIDNSGLVNKTKEYQDEIKVLQERIKDEKTTQNYLINNLRRLGQQQFEQKFDASEKLVNDMEKQIETLNLKLSNIQISIKPFHNTREDLITMGLREEEFQKIANFEFTAGDPESEGLRKIIDSINVDNEYIRVNLINGNSFVLVRPN